MIDRRPLGLPEFSSPQAEDDERPAARRRLPVERGAQFLAPPASETDASVPCSRRTLGDGGLSFSAPDQQP
jgi:hypothetical protein